MDGMGETYRTMRAALLENDPAYASDLLFEGDYECIPSDVAAKASESAWDYREGESVYTFSKSSSDRTISVRPIFKRFVEERSPPALYNHGFENMASAGALYSRASSHVFGDWNACGKVMGLAPWMGHVWDDDEDEGKMEAAQLEEPVMWGHLYVDEGEEGGFGSDVSAMKGLPHIARADPDLFDGEGNMRRRYDFDDCDGDDFVPPPQEESEDGSGSDQSSTTTPRVIDAAIKNVRLPPKVALDAISLSHRIQSDLENVVLDFVRHFKSETGEKNLCIAGGVALNSVLNGKLSRDLGFEKVFIPPYPGDDGIAVGCCAYGLWGNAALPAKAKEADVGEGEGEREEKKEKRERVRPPLWSEPLPPYLGPYPTDASIESALQDAAPWLLIEHVPSQSKRHSLIAQELADSGVVALYRGRSEMGPRALGHRSILADPRKKGLVRFINERVKSRESFRPFAPSALAEYAPDWFDLGGMDSPYMSLTARVKDGKRGKIPAVTHVDGSSRLQTVTEESEPSYHALIQAFYDLTGVPLVLNTSFNTLPGEPIVECPRDAVRSFLYSMGSIEMLAMGEYVVRRRDADVRSLLGKVKKDGTVVSPPLRPVRAGPFVMESTTAVGGGPNSEDQEVRTTTRVRMPSRIMHDSRPDKDRGWFDLLDDLEVQVLAMCDGENDVQDMLAEYLDDPDDDDETGGTGETETQDEQYQANLFSNIMRRLTRLYEYGFVSW
uniref:Carbamoyltransferase n=1 Tax=Odontella aurita TaxID=265563 RepID=A0A7S4MZR6_9STRA